VIGEGGRIHEEGNGFVMLVATVILVVVENCEENRCRTDYFVNVIPVSP
jgi:hypothetical protein